MTGIAQLAAYKVCHWRVLFLTDACGKGFWVHFCMIGVSFYVSAYVR
jgi:hypothetical protein